MMQMLQPVSNDLEYLEQNLSNYLHSEHPYIQNINLDIVAGGGKRLRPALFFLVSQLLGYTSELRFELAAALEYIHSASLLHDDVIDNSKIRRGVPTVNSKWNNTIAILAGDRTYAVACRMFLAAKNFDAMHRIASCIQIMSESEILQHELLWNSSTTLNQYWEVITGKTAILFESAAATPVMLLNLPKNIENLFSSFGKSVGLAFQIVDDCLDFEASEKDLGKPVMTDLLEGKITLPILLLLQQQTDIAKDTKKIIENICQNKAATPEQLHLIKERVIASESLTNAKLMAKQFARQAEETLTQSASYFSSDFTKSKAYESLISIANFFVDRKF